MSATVYFLAVLNVIINSQTFEDCGSQSISVGTNQDQRTLTIQLERDLANSQVRITLTGPTDKWYGFVIGQGTMGNGYGVYGSGADPNFVVTEQRLQYYGGGSALSSSSSTGTPDTTWDDATNIATITLTRPLSVSSNGYYDFTNVLGPQCTGETMGFGGVIGSSNDYNGMQHEYQIGGQVFTSTCSCPTDPPTVDPTSDPSADPTTDPTDNPSMAGVTIDPSVDPTADPTMDPTITEVISASTTMSDGISTSMDISTTMDDGYELCAMKELLGTKLYISRNIDENMVRIAMSGPSTVWFGYGFGSAAMTGAYGVTVEAADSANLVHSIRERTLAKDSTAGTLLTPSGSIEVLKNDTMAYAMLERAYASTNGGFDFTDFLKCNVESIDLIAGLGDSEGSGTMIGYHGSTTANRVSGMILTRLESCICEDDTNIDDMTTTNLPGEGGSASNIVKGLNILSIVSLCIYSIIIL